VGAESARLLSAEWGTAGGPRNPDPDGQVQLHRLVHAGGAVSPPFAFKGFELSEIWGDVAHPEAVAALDQQIDITTGRRPVAERLMELETSTGRSWPFCRGVPPGLPPARAPTVTAVPVGVRCVSSVDERARPQLTER